MKKTFLYEEHVKIGGKMVEFGGYMLPVWFSSLKEEHLAVRKDVGCFDISHMGIFLFSGERAKDFLQKISCNNIEKTKDSKMIYSMILNHDGMVLDDIMVGKLDDNEYVMVVNASNKDKLMQWFQNVGLEDLVLKYLSDTHGFIAVQGPNAIKRLTDIFKIDFSDRARFSVFNQEILAKTCIVMRTGYTGEDGAELVVPKEIISKTWRMLLDANITACGLGARDSLRLEAGLPLYGQELSEKINPLMTRYQWVIAWDKDFIGKEALIKYRDKVPAWVTVGMEMIDKGIPRAHYPIVEGGKVTSGTFSPYLDKAIGIALVKFEFSEIGTELNVVIRRKAAKAKVVKLPFYNH